MPRDDVLAHLRALYAASEDTWRHRSAPYEAAKYRATLVALGPGPFREALEIGCGNGTLAGLLAPRCRRLTAIDVTPEAVRLARRDLAHLPHVRVLQGAAPRDLPRLRPDLVVLSEVLYFLTPGEIADLGRWLRRHAAGPVLAVNWTGPTDEPLDGPAAVAHLAEHLGPARTEQFPGFRTDLFLLPGVSRRAAPA